MAQRKRKSKQCPDCGKEMWYDADYEYWICDECGSEIYEEGEERDEEEES